MRILVVATFTHPDHPGGAERVIHELARRLAERHDVALLTSNPGTAPADERRDGVRIVRYAVDRSSPLRFWRSVFRGVRGALGGGLGSDCDVWSLHQLLSGLAAVAPGRPRRPTVLTFHAPYHLEYLARWRDGRADGRAPPVPRMLAALLRRGDRRLLARADEVLVLSRFAAGQVSELLPDALERLTVSPAGVDLERFRPAAGVDERVRLAAGFGVPAGAPLVVTVRRLVPRMGLTDLVDAAALLARRGLAFTVAIAGEGPERSRLEEQVRAAGLQGRVTLLGRVPEERLPELYRAASAFALPTRSLEGFGMATAEALASGLAVVATRVGANGELLDGVDGARLVPAADPTALADALAALLTDPTERERAARNARRHAEAHLGWDGHLAAFETAAIRAAARAGAAAARTRP